ncbi:hypothetical protein D3C86_1908670 [compost metagenome]
MHDDSLFDIGASHIIDLFQTRSTFGQRHQFLCQLFGVGGKRNRLRGQHFDAHVVEQLRAGIGAIHRRYRHGEQFFAQIGVNTHGVEHAPYSLQQLRAQLTPGFEVGRFLNFQECLHERLGIRFIDQL